MKERKSPGADNIGPKIIKKSAAAIVERLVYLYNLPFYTGCVPDKLKLAKIIPMFKKGDSSNPGNYRPISLLSIFDKLLEKFIAAASGSTGGTSPPPTVNNKGVKTKCETEKSTGSTRPQCTCVQGQLLMSLMLV